MLCGQIFHAKLDLNQVTPETGDLSASRHVSRWKPGNPLRSIVDVVLPTS